jgi:hypothetical protein
MKILFVISNPESIQALIGLVDACARRNHPFLCFFTGGGVEILRDSKVINAISKAEQAVVCEFSWRKYFPNKQSPIEEGSQTNHSAMISHAEKVVSL